MLFRSQLGFAPRPNAPEQRQLILELMGRHSNLFLLDEHQQVISSGRQVREHQSRLRPISTGDTYSAPPPLQGAEPQQQESLEPLLLQEQSLQAAALLPAPRLDAAGMASAAELRALRGSKGSKKVSAPSDSGSDESSGGGWYSPSKDDDASRSRRGNSATGEYDHSLDGDDF